MSNIHQFVYQLLCLGSSKYQIDDFIAAKLMAWQTEEVKHEDHGTHRISDPTVKFIEMHIRCVGIPASCVGSNSGWRGETEDIQVVAMDRCSDQESASRVKSKGWKWAWMCPELCHYGLAHKVPHNHLQIQQPRLINHPCWTFKQDFHAIEDWCCHPITQLCTDRKDITRTHASHSHGKKEPPRGSKREQQTWPKVKECKPS